MNVLNSSFHVHFQRSPDSLNISGLSLFHCIFKLELCTGQMSFWKIQGLSDLLLLLFFFFATTGRRFWCRISTYLAEFMLLSTSRNFPTQLLETHLQNVVTSLNRRVDDHGYCQSRKKPTVRRLFATHALSCPFPTQPESRQKKNHFPPVCIKSETQFRSTPCTFGFSISSPWK